MISIKWQIVKIILVVFFLNDILSQGICGPENPVNSTDCLKTYSNSTDLCCLLSGLEVPSKFKSCIHLKSNAAFSYLTVGNLKYNVDCKGAPDYATYFPFEPQYSTCGIQSPIQTSDCSAFDTTTTSCCMASTDAAFNYNSNVLCYYYPNKNNNLVLGILLK